MRCVKMNRTGEASRSTNQRCCRLWTMILIRPWVTQLAKKMHAEGSETKVPDPLPARPSASVWIPVSISHPLSGASGRPAQPTV